MICFFFEMFSFLNVRSLCDGSNVATTFWEEVFSTWAAGRITARIRLLITKQNTLTFFSIACGSKELWSKVREVTGKNRSNDGQSLNFSANMLNEHYASVSNDGKYTHTLRKLTEPIEGAVQTVTEEQVFHLLDNLEATSAGTDGIPH